MTSEVQLFKDDFNDFISELDERAVSIKLVRHTGRVMNATTGKLDAGTTQELTVTGVIINISNTDANIDGATVIDTSKRLLIDSQVAPQKDDNVIVDGDNLGVPSITEVNPGGVLIGYFLDLSR